jgi:prepilin-type N-terminal cleavage/methylation domain-containing protein
LKHYLKKFLVPGQNIHPPSSSEDHSELDFSDILFPKTMIDSNFSQKKGFTLVEIMLSITIFALLMTTVLESVQNMTFVRIKTENRVKLLEELYFFSENLVTYIKDGWSLDYEEYWNRQSFNTEIGTGHYIFPTWVWNYGSGGIITTDTYGDLHYYCRSGTNNTERVGTGGCLWIRNASLTWAVSDRNYSGTYQRYGQYVLQYMDYNGNADADGWVPGDEDNDLNISGDEDDKDIGDGPEVISWALTELYLIDQEWWTRTFFRWIVRPDPNAPAWTTCVLTGTLTGSGCIGNIQVLRLRWVDLGMDHSGTLVSSTNGAFDGTIDTWVCHIDWNCMGPDIGNGYGNLATWHDSEWVDIFPDTVHVKSIRFTAYPKKDPWKAWGSPDALQWSDQISPFIHPYVRVELTLGFAWGKRRLLNGDDPNISLNTTLSLSDGQ